MAKNWNWWSRKLHRWGAIGSALPMLLVITTGLLLQVKKQVPWVQPATQAGQAKNVRPEQDWTDLLTVVQSIPEAAVTDWADIDRIDVRPSKGTVKVTCKNRWEVQIDYVNGEVLSSAYRRSDLIESLHDGSFFSDFAKLGVFLPNGLVLMSLWLTGVWLWVLPLRQRSKRKSRVLPEGPSRRAFSLVELLVVLAIIATLISLILPAVHGARESSRRMSCQSNLRQLGLALHAFENSYRRFPPSGWTEANPNNPAGKYVGWRALTLPFIEQTNTQKLVDFQLHWWEGTNATVASVQINIFQCPSTPTRIEVLSAIAKSPRPALTFANPIAGADYEAMMGVQPASINAHLNRAVYNTANRFSVLHRNSSTRFAEITDGTSNTVVLVESSARPAVYHRRRMQPTLANDQGIGWADSEGAFSLDGASRDGSREGCGANCSAAMNAKNDNEPYSFHHGGSNLLYADAHVTFVSESVDLPVFAATCTKLAGEAIRPN
ncbi:MAG: DUF1559 domain-containing protein [Pirellulaceae bacterium]